MPSPSDPIQAIARVQRMIVSVGALACLALAAWAILPLLRPAGSLAMLDHPLHQTPSSAPRLAIPGEADGRESTDLSFAAPLLWNPPPPPPQPRLKAEPEPVNEREITLELIAIVLQDGVHRAALYDKESDRLHILGPSQSIGRYTITNVEARQVTLGDGTRTLTLALQEPGNERRR